VTAASARIVAAVRAHARVAFGVPKCTNTHNFRKEIQGLMLLGPVCEEAMVLLSPDPPQTHLYNHSLRP